MARQNRGPNRVQVERGIVLVRRGYSGAGGRQGECSTWTARIHVGGYRYTYATGRRDRAAAEAAAIRRRDALERRAEGLEDYTDAQDVTLRSLVDAWASSLRSAGRTPDYVRQSVGRVLALVEGARTLAALTPQTIRARLDVLRTSHELPEGHPMHGRVGFSPRTADAYLVVLGTWFAWLVREGRWHTNPVDSIQRSSVKPARVRRALTLAELRALLATAPIARRACYLLAVSTGFRRAELDALTWADVDLDGGVVRLDATRTKNRQHAAQPLPAVAVACLREHRAALASGKRGVGRVARAAGWRQADRVVVAPTVRTLRRDLEAAGVALEGVAVDLHSLRKTLATLAQGMGASLTTAQALMRHSTPVLTANAYTDVWTTETRAAMDKLDAALAAPEPNTTEPATDPVARRQDRNRRFIPAAKPDRARRSSVKAVAGSVAAKQAHKSRKA